MLGADWLAVCARKMKTAMAVILNLAPIMRIVKTESALLTREFLIASYVNKIAEKACSVK